MQTKEVQGQLWSSAPKDWAKYLEPTFIPMYQAVLKKIELDEEMMLLDAGCGTGLFLSMSSPSGATIHGIDAAPGLLDISKTRLPGASLLIEDLEELPFANETFDVVTGFNSFQYAGSFINAFSEAMRVTKQYGKVILGIWGKEEDCDAGSVLKAVASLLPPPPPGTPGPFALSEDGKVESICKKIGLKLIEKQTVFCPWQFTTIGDLQRGILSTSPCVKAMQVVGEDAVKKAITQSAQPYNLVDDIYFMRNHFTFFITEKL